MFSLLTRIGDFVSLDDMNLSRNFVRVCISLLGVLVQRRESSGGSGEYLGRMHPPSLSKIRVRAQRDLWDNVGATLHDVSIDPPPPDVVTSTEPSAKPT